MPNARIAAANARMRNASVSVRSRMMTFRQMASSAIITTERIWTMVSRRSATTRSDFLNSSNDHGKDHTEHSLEDRVVGRVEAPGQNEPEQNFQAQVPDGSDDDNGDQCRQEHDDDAFESL